VVVSRGHAYYPQVTFCQIGTWEAVYPPPTSPPQVTQSPPPQVTEEPVTGKEQFRCRDPNTNFVYERPEPCAKGDETLSRSGSSPPAPAQDHAALCHHIDEQFALCSIAAGNEAAMMQQQWKAEIAQGQMVSDAEQNAMGDLFKACQKYSDAHDQNGCPPEQ
jgi:hypothetical protein